MTSYHGCIGFKLVLIPSLTDNKNNVIVFFTFYAMFC